MPQHAGEKGEVYAALVELSDADPLISLRQDDDGVTYVSLYGEVQKEVIRDTLALEFGLTIDFAETTTLYIERPSDEGSFFEEAFTPSNPFVATMGVRISSAAPESGVTYRIEVEFGSYRPISSQPTRRQHKGINPYNRREYLMHLNRVLG